MDSNIKILLNKYKNIDSINLNANELIELNSNYNEFNEYDINTYISQNDVFEKERQNTPIYRIYGKINYLSLLNRLKLNYSFFEDFFLPQDFNNKNIFNSFRFYLVRPASIKYAYNSISNNTNLWIRNFEVVTILDKYNLDIYPAGFSKNIFGDQIYLFNINIDINISDYYDFFNFPLTEIYLFVVYLNDNKNNEKMYFTKWNLLGNKTISPYYNNNNLIVGDVLKTSKNEKINDIIYYDKQNFIQKIVQNQNFIIMTPIIDNGSVKYLQWKYNPLIPLKLRYLTNELYKVNINNSYYDIIEKMPNYATKLDNIGNYVWRNIQPEGYYNPITGDGNNIPFVNNRRYFYSDINLNIIPNLDDDFTKNKFSEIKYDNNIISITNKINNNINDIGLPCK